jgi:uncharacterized protein YkwD
MRRLAVLLVLGTALAVTAGCAQPATGTNWVAPAGADASTQPSDSPSADPSPVPSAAGTPSGPAAPSTTGTPGKPGNPKPPPPPAGSGLVQQLLAQVNQLRAQHGLPPYKLSSGLIASAHLHNLAMIPPNGCGLSHRCPGEPDLGPRIKAQGVNWHTAGENVGESGPIANNDAAILATAKGLTMAMYNEKPPNDGHRRNILSSDFTMIGIDVIRDAKGTVWLTQDFAG